MIFVVTGALYVVQQMVSDEKKEVSCIIYINRNDHVSSKNKKYDLILMKYIFYMYMYIVKCVLESHLLYLQKVVFKTGELKKIVHY